jgi:hypothetical protein
MRTLSKSIEKVRKGLLQSMRFFACDTGWNYEAKGKGRRTKG